MSLLDLGATLPEAASRPVLETERLLLRAPQLADVTRIAELARDQRVAENTTRIPHPYHLGDAEDWVTLANADPRDHTLLVTMRQSGQVIGACSLEWREQPYPEIGYWIGVPYWGHGYATEAVQTLIDHGFSISGNDAIDGGARPTNAASRRVLEKCGFQWTGVGLYRIRVINSSAPFDRFRLERRNWMSLKRWGQSKTTVRDRG